MSTPFGTIVYSPPNHRRPVQAAASETAIRAESWLARRLAGCRCVPADVRRERLVHVDDVVVAGAKLAT